MQNIRILIMNSMSRYFHASSTTCDIIKQSKVMKKIMAGGRSKRKGFYTNQNVNNKPVLFDKMNNEQPAHVLKRVNALNKIFMEHITDFMSTGELDPELLDLNIEISHVQVTADFKLANVHWMSFNEKSNSPRTDELLQNCGLRLRHELSQLRVMGNVPPIYFVRCKRIGSLVELERRLKIADYGEDFQCSTYASDPTQTVTNIETTEPENVTNADKVFSVSVPVMRNDVFGLDHHHIMSKIKASLNKSKNIPRNLPLNNRSTLNVQSFISSPEQEEEFQNFLDKRKREERFKSKVQRYETNEEDKVPEEEEQIDCDNDIYDDYDDDYESYDNNFQREDDDMYRK